MPSKKSDSDEKVDLLSIFKSEISDSSSTIRACADLIDLQDKDLQEMEASVAALNKKIRELRKSQKDTSKEVTRRAYLANAKYIGQLVYSTGVSKEDFPVLVGIADLLAHGTSNLDKDFSDFLFEMRHNGEVFIEQNKFALSDAPFKDMDAFKKEIADSLASEKEKKVTTPKSKKPKKAKKSSAETTDAEGTKSSESIPSAVDTKSVEENSGSSFAEVPGQSDDEGAVVNG